MSDQANVELVNAWFAALGSGDTHAAVNLLSDDAVWHTGGRGRFAGDFEGKEAIVESLDRFAPRPTRSSMTYMLSSLTMSTLLHSITQR